MEYQPGSTDMVFTAFAGACAFSKGGFALLEMDSKTLLSRARVMCGHDLSLEPTTAASDLKRWPQPGLKQLSFCLEGGQRGLSAPAAVCRSATSLWPPLDKCHFCGVQEVLLCCVVAHVEGFEPVCWPSLWFSEAERWFPGMCAGLWCRNRDLVLWGCGAKATALVPAFPCSSMSTCPVRSVCPHRKWNFRNLALGREDGFWRANFSRAGTRREIWLVEGASGKKVLQVRCFHSWQSV